MMPAVAIGFERSAATLRTCWANDARRVLRAFLGALDRLVPPPQYPPSAKLPAEWFKYPPI
jgi:hypothetical protein